MITRTEKNKVEHEKIKREETINKTKNAILKFLKYFFIIALLSVVTITYVYYVSTKQLIVREYSKVYSTLPDNFNGIKIVQISDLYYDNNYSDILNEIVSKTNKLKPNIIIFSGGLIHKNYVLKESEKSNLIEKLSKLDAVIGKYFVISDNDDEETVDILTKSNFKFLDDNSETIYYKSQTPILLSGLSKTSNVDYSNNNNLFNIIIVNDSKKIDEIISNNNPNIIMSGKNLNGQLRIPYYGALFKHNEYTDEHYTINDIDIFISGGIGTNNIPLRIFNHPSINLYRLKSN